MTNVNRACGLRRAATTEAIAFLSAAMLNIYAVNIRFYFRSSSVYNLR